MVWVIVIAIGIGGLVLVFLVPPLMHAFMKTYSVGVVDFLFLLIAGGALFAAGYFTARFVHASQTVSIVIGVVVPATLGLGRLAWIALGLPTPGRDYQRLRDEDHRKYWG